ncbi:50S ribosomal protein L25 [Candidatus Parcubacteria bacterium]|nr:MAG: 50S ribosomal protein L25 [Candidatus Parcubacteria bacterium]
MTKKMNLTAILRSAEDKNVNELRKTGLIPANIYGKGIKNKSIKINLVDFEKIYESAGESTLIDVEIDKEKATVIIKDVQFNAVKDKIEHVDFYQVDMKETIDVEIPLEFVGESILEKDSTVSIVKNLETINVRCLPGDLVEKFEVDMSKIKKFGDTIKVGDIALPESYKLITLETDAIVSTSEVQVVEEESTVTEESAEAVAEPAKEDEAQEQK